MSQYDPLVPARYYSRLAEVLMHEGIDWHSLLHSLRLSPQMLTRPDAMIRVSQIDRLVQRLHTLSGRSDLGFEVGRRLSVSAHGFVGFGMLNSPNLDQALRFEAKYFRLILPSFRMHYTRTADYGEIHVTPCVVMTPLCMAHHLETIGITIICQMAELSGGYRPPCRLELSIPEPPHIEKYARELHGVQIRFNADPTPCVRVRLLRDPVGLPLVMADPHALKIAETRCRTLVQQATDDRRFADWITMTLREIEEGVPTLEELAATLNISKRTLNRYLEREGTSFRELAGRVQHDLACERLSRDMSVSEVAYSLGFNDLSNFARSFRARAGYSPRQHSKK
jgi:AraC-like DNA-binding protein